MEQLNELKNLVMQNLQKNGYLSNIRAQIRSSVFKTIDSQQTSNKKQSPFYSENAKIQKLSETKQGQQVLELIQQTVNFYKMDNSLNIFNSQSNSKIQTKRQDLARKNNIELNSTEPVLYSIFSRFISKNKSSKQSKKQSKAAESMNLKQDQSEGQIEQEIVKNQSRKFGQSQQFGQSQGHDMSVDSMQLEQYDYVESIQ